VHLTWIKPHGSIYMNDGSITRSTREMRMTETERPYFAKPFARRRSAKPATVSCHEQVVQGILGLRGLELINCPPLSGRQWWLLFAGLKKPKTVFRLRLTISSGITRDRRFSTFDRRRRWNGKTASRSWRVFKACTQETGRPWQKMR